MSRCSIFQLSTVKVHLPNVSGTNEGSNTNPIDWLVLSSGLRSGLPDTRSDVAILREHAVNDVMRLARKSASQRMKSVCVDRRAYSLALTCSRLGARNPSE